MCGSGCAIPRGMELVAPSSQHLKLSPSPTVSPSLPRTGPDPCEHVPDCGNQPRPRQWAGAGGHGPCDHQDSRQHSHHGRPGCGSGDVGTVTCGQIMALFSSLLQNFYTLQRCNQMELSLSTLEEKYC